MYDGFMHNADSEIIYLEFWEFSDADGSVICRGKKTPHIGVGTDERIMKND